jgi:hypothetical protein
VLAVDVGFDGAAVPGADVCDAIADGQHLDAQLMAWDPGVAEERHLAEVAAVVGATDANLTHPEQGLAGTRRGGFGNVEEPEGLGAFELEGAHGRFFWVRWVSTGRRVQPRT